MQEPKDIENLFNNAFDSFEVEAPADVWANISQQISPATNSPSTNLGRAWMKPAAYAAAILGISLSTYILVDSNDNDPVIDTPNEMENILDDVSIKAAEDLSFSTEDNDNKDYVAHSNDAVNTSHKDDNNGKSDEDLEEYLKENKVKIIDYTVDEPLTLNDLRKDDQSEIDEDQTPVNKNSHPEKVNTPSPPPSAKILVSSKGGEAPLVVLFNNGGTADYYDWDFGDGFGSSHLGNPQRKFDEPGVYNVRLTTKNKNGVTATDHITITVRAPSKILVPNIFSPNADGQNDKFIVSGESIKTIEGTIIDPQSGKVIYQWSRLQDGWDGKLPNQLDAPAGNYFYTIKYIGSNDKTESIRGTFRLERKN